MKKETKPFSWIVLNLNYYDNGVGECDILKFREAEFKKMKKKAKTKEDFSKELRAEMRYHFWCRVEYETVVELSDDGRVFLSPFLAPRGAENSKIDVTDRKDFDWLGFAKFHIERQTHKNKAKIDVYDQLEWKWDDFVDYCWGYRHKWERAKEDK